MPTKPKTSWRDVLPIHPACDLFPPPSEAELRALGEDIKHKGVLIPVVLWSETPEHEPQLLAGKSRLDAAEFAGVSVFEIREDKGMRVDLHVPFRRLYGSGGGRSFDGTDLNVDPYEFVLSENIHRRHLTPEQKRELVAAVVKVQPGKSNRAIAAEVKVDDKTVGAVRRELEATAEIPQLNKTTGKDGKTRTTTPAKKAVSSAAAPVSDAAVTKMTDRLKPPPKSAALKPPAPVSCGMHLQGDKVDEIVNALHRLAGNGLDVKPASFLASLGNETRRTNTLGSARKAHEWLGELLDDRG